MHAVPATERPSTHNMLIKMRKNAFFIITLLATLPIWLVACKQKDEAAPSVPEVGVMQAHVQDVPLIHDLVGRLAPTRVAEVRARVNGIVEKRAYKEGTDVDKGQILFRIDPAPMQAALDEQQAGLKQTLASAHNDRTKAERTRTLAARGVISKQALDDANAAARSSQAAVAKARATVETAKLDLSYTKVTAPIAGRAGRALVTEGALVSQSAATQLTTIEQIDPLYVDFSQPLEVVQLWQKEQASGEVVLDDPEHMTVRLILPDGSDYGVAGQLDFTDMRVDPETGSVSLRAQIPNPQQQLLPGMFIKVQLDAGTLRRVMLIPQQALLRDGNSAYVLTVDPQNTVTRKTIQTRGIHGGNWIVESGLNEGDQVIVSGLQQARQGSQVNPTPWVAKQPAPAATAASSQPSS